MLCSRACSNRRHLGCRAICVLPIRNGHLFSLAIKIAGPNQLQWYVVYSTTSPPAFIEKSVFPICGESHYLSSSTLSSYPMNIFWFSSCSINTWAPTNYYVRVASEHNLGATVLDTLYSLSSWLQCISWMSSIFRWRCNHEVFPAVLHTVATNTSDKYLMTSTSPEAPSIARGWHQREWYLRFHQRHYAKWDSAAVQREQTSGVRMTCATFCQSARASHVIVQSHTSKVKGFCISCQGQKPRREIIRERRRYQAVGFISIIGGSWQDASCEASDEASYRYEHV